MDSTNLTLDEKCALVAGVSSMRTAGLPEKGIPQLKMSDGPNGVSGEGHLMAKTPSIGMPVGIAMGASWDPALVGRVADRLGAQAHAWGIHALLGPTINLQRTPVGGRVFECFSEDPELTAALTVAYVRAVQAHGVAAVVKHFVCNDTELDRHRIDVHVDERPLRELYLRPFEDAVTLAGVWGLMSAYNKVRGTYASANTYLLRDILRDEWGFDGAVVSDWYGTNDTVGPAVAGLSIEMPGPPRFYGTALAEAVRRGEVDETTVDALVADVLRLVERTDAAARPASTPERVVDDPGVRRVARDAAIAGTVLLCNDGTLPVAPETVRRVAVIGPNAARCRMMGGGSSAIRPVSSKSLLAALRERFGDDAVAHEPGVRIDRLTPFPHPSSLRAPDGEPGCFELRYTNGHDGDHDDEPVAVRTDVTRFFHLGSAPVGVDTNAFTAELRGSFVPTQSGPHTFGIVVSGPADVVVDGQTVLKREDKPARGFTFFGMGSEELFCTVDAEAGRPVSLAITVYITAGFGGARLGIKEPEADDLFERAVAAARQADVAVVVVGTTEEWESEGEDRTTIELPGRQDELVREVAAACGRTVVVLNAGAPVAMPWLDEVGAVVVPFFGGVEMGDALADVLSGVADPGGRLPITYPRRLEDTPAWPYYAPLEGRRQVYGEGLFMGYRGYDAAGVEPLFPFGHGLSYGSATWGAAVVETDGTRCGRRIRVPLSNTGDRAATVVVQCYVAAVDPPVERPPKELKAFAKATVLPGGATDVELVLDDRSFRRWDQDARSWTVDAGDYDLVLAESAGVERQRLRVTVL